MQFSQPVKPPALQSTSIIIMIFFLFFFNFRSFIYFFLRRERGEKPPSFRLANWLNPRPWNPELNLLFTSFHLNLEMLLCQGAAQLRQNPKQNRYKRRMGEQSMPCRHFGKTRANLSKAFPWDCTSLLIISPSLATIAQQSLKKNLRTGVFLHHS